MYYHIEQQIGKDIENTKVFATNAKIVKAEKDVHLMQNMKRR